MKPHLVLPVSGTGGPPRWPAIGTTAPASSALLIIYAHPAATEARFLPPNGTMPPPPRPTPQLVGPGEQSENEEEDADDLELENDEDHSKLRVARTPPGTEEGSTAARGNDGTINPPFP